ncbi:MAG: hypothetical protein Q9217_004667 [Psora testacea]
MATYGKRRKGLLSPFSVFRDDEQDENGKQERLAYRRLAKAETTEQRPWSRLREDDESIDELAGETLLKDVPQHPQRVASLHNELTFNKYTRLKSGISTQGTAEGFDKPLPPTPSKSRKASRDHKTRSALTAKTTNSKVQKHGDVQAPRLKVSPPTLQSPASSAMNVDSRPATSQSVKTLPALHSATNDPADLNRKISHLMQQAAAQEVESERRAAILADISAKSSPLQRGKQAFVKATRALKSRLSNGSSTVKIRAEKVTPARSASSPSSAGGGRPFGIELNDKHCKGKLDRRKAEGVNLSNPKIQSLMGDGNISRKPLPIYESMRSRVQQSHSLEDPFSDDNDAKRKLASRTSCGVDVDFDKHKHKGKAGKARVPLTTDKQGHGTARQLEQQPAAPQQEPRFSNMISGLAQHSDTTYLSSSPIAQSTPYDRLLPRPADANNKRLSALTRSPSILEFSFEGQSDDEHSVALSAASKTITDGSQSVKRKSGQENLRSPAAPANKKARLATRTSRDEDANLADGFNNLETKDGRIALLPDENNAKRPPPPRLASKGKGLAIFDVGKGKAKDSRQDEPPAKKQRSKGLVGNRSSFPRPSSLIFGRDSRTGNMNFAKLDDDMEVDELA